MAEELAGGRLHTGWRSEGFAAGHVQWRSMQAITVNPGPQSYHSQDAATIHMSGGVVTSIKDDHGQALSSYELEPLLITGLSEDANRTKRRLVTYDEIPPNLVQAVVAIEDRRFFEHGGVNYLRLLQAGIRTM